ncbi:hypothetical protein NQ318_006179 [Aromia moschata]|uniref:Transmembrane protein 177 n=1 Tax=Aromia moschata TaxID=1265417 RepID=A0AAV8XTC3_9CUCU|nr:hypothetical protein NQ318_006179 [Aromia moschata]
MTTAKIGAWFLTDAGKKFCYYSAGTATLGVLCATFLPHTLLLNQYKDIIQLYKNGISVPLSTKLQERFQKAIDLVEIDPQDRHLYQPFFYCGFDITSIGSSYSRFGVLVGLPANFAYENVDMVDKSKLKVNQNEVVWDSEDGQKLLNSLVLSENAQLYAMAREIQFRNTPKPLLDTMIGTTSCILTYSLSNHINSKFNFYAKPRGLRVALYALVGLFSFGVYAMCKDVSQMYYESSIDRELKQKSELLAEGGKEYYSKILERNQSIRKLMGKEGEKLYSILGNENYLFRNKHLPIVQRKSFFDEPLSIS